MKDDVIKIMKLVYLFGFVSGSMFFINLIFFSLIISIITLGVSVVIMMWLLVLSEDKIDTLTIKIKDIERFKDIENEK